MSRERAAISGLDDAGPARGGVYGGKSLVERGREVLVAGEPAIWISPDLLHARMVQSGSPQGSFVPLRSWTFAQPRELRQTRQMITL
ncbi:hypothetical protein OG782_00130 [Streptomyces sp. NBC_00876]|uniref:hypothetical protein n=1 Tax=Streptomyces sp. NBC_00876 TaxID=2975853 RepID=UPI00386B265C|nr:hypothetical protein OG782_00130 [Streptomyces sp. NBC_00876]